MSGIVSYLVFFLIQALVFAIVCLGLNLQWGYTGLFNIGVSGFYLVGAYAFALLCGPAHAGIVAGWGLPFIVGLFAWLSVYATLWPLMVAKVVQEIIGYGLLVPAQQVLFTVVSRTEKYESKAFIDTVVFRGSDVAASNVVDALGRFSASAAAMAILPLIGAWMALGAWLGGEQTARAQAAEKNALTPSPSPAGRGEQDTVGGKQTF